MYIAGLVQNDIRYMGYEVNDDNNNNSIIYYYYNRVETVFWEKMNTNWLLILLSVFKWLRDWISIVCSHPPHYILVAHNIQYNVTYIQMSRILCTFISILFVIFTSFDIPDTSGIYRQFFCHYLILFLDIILLKSLLLDFLLWRAALQTLFRGAVAKVL